MERRDRANSSIWLGLKSLTPMARIVGLNAVTVPSASFNHPVALRKQRAAFLVPIKADLGRSRHGCGAGLRQCLAEDSGAPKAIVGRRIEKKPLFDTAPDYGFGRSEEILGKALAQAGRQDRVVIATKVGLDWHDGTLFRNASRARIVKRLRICSAFANRCD